MDRDDYFDDVQVRILRVTEDLRSIQRELNFADMISCGAARDVGGILYGTRFERPVAAEQIG